MRKVSKRDLEYCSLHKVCHVICGCDEKYYVPLNRKCQVGPLENTQKGERPVPKSWNYTLVF